MVVIPMWPHACRYCRSNGGFLHSYPHHLISVGQWTSAEQQALLNELELAQRRASLWITPALVEMVWIQP